MRFALLAAMFALCACQTPTVAVQQVCLPMVNYTPAQEQAAATALSALEPLNPLVGFTADYGAMRAADRACLANTGNPAK